jgi:polyisoprenyl-phosphate glycosyltransferase
MNDTTTREEGSTSPSPAYSIVIPVYRSELILEELHERVAATFRDIDGDFELILVNDCSPDGSWQVMEQLHDKDPRVRIIQLMKNSGQFRALMCGLEHVSGEYVITMDDDLQHQPEDIPRLISGIDRDDSLDGVIGVPEGKKQHAPVRNLGSYLFRRLNQRFYDVPSGLQMGSFRILRREVVNAMVANNSVNVTIGPLLLSLTRNLTNVPVNHQPRRSGTSGYGLFRLFKTTLDNVLNCSTLPLQIIVIVGLVTSTIGLGFGMYTLGLKVFRGVGIEGWTTIVVLISFFSGCILLSLGVIGEYLIRIVRELSGEQQYVVRRKKF